MRGGERAHDHPPSPSRERIFSSLLGWASVRREGYFEVLRGRCPLGVTLASCRPRGAFIGRCPALGGRVERHVDCSVCRLRPRGATSSIASDPAGGPFPSCSKLEPTSVIGQTHVALTGFAQLRETAPSGDRSAKCRNKPQPHGPTAATVGRWLSIRQNLRTSSRNGTTDPGIVAELAKIVFARALSFFRASDPSCASAGDSLAHAMDAGPQIGAHEGARVEVLWWYTPSLVRKRTPPDTRLPSDTTFPTPYKVGEVAKPLPQQRIV